MVMSMAYYESRKDAINEIIRLFQIQGHEEELADIIYTIVMDRREWLRWAFDNGYYWHHIPINHEIDITLHQALIQYCEQPVDPEKNINAQILRKLFVLEIYLTNGVTTWERDCFYAIRNHICFHPNISWNIAVRYLSIYNFCFADKNQSVFRTIYLDISNTFIQTIYSELLKNFQNFVNNYNLHIKVTASIIYIYFKNINPTIGPDEELMLKRVPKLYRVFKRYIIGRSMEELWRQGDVERGRVYLSNDFFIDM